MRIAGFGIVKKLCKIGLCLAAALWCGAALAGTPLEDAVKTTFLYKFSPFVQWPDSASQTFNICVIGNEGIGNALAQAIAGQRYGARIMAARNLTAVEADCQIAYVPGNDAPAVAAMLDATRGKPVLTISDLPNNAPAHGIIDFVIEDGHVRFDIDDAAAAQSGLTISSKLLSLARSVNPRGAP